MSKRGTPPEVQNYDGEPVATGQYRKIRGTDDWGIAGEVVAPGVVAHEGMLCLIEKRNGSFDYVTAGEIIIADGAGNFTAKVRARQTNVL